MSRRDIAQGRSIAFVGMMGVGKTTIGRRLAQRLGLPFADADHEIVEAAGLEITEIFDRFGEPHFRDGERRVIRRMLEGPQMVIATGGGAFMNEETRALMLDQSYVIWLDANLDTLVERVSRKNDRPLLQNGNPREILTELAAVRTPVYALAHLHVKSNVGPHEKTVDYIVKHFLQ